ncbi:hypothetical protein [Sporosalibacterium faouarense]|uniref:hypothetical protein n=1 Tax=Sporosalibacterium faouarense TaxID=516123 RepID=UPI00192AC193|nr:hypothetical protein [Sporosalibacterium faouarense]
MIGVRLLIHLIPEKWSNFELNKAYSEEKPKWIWGVGIFSIFIVIVTWYKEITTEVHLSIILSILITLTLIKVSQILFNYNKFRSFVTKALVEDRRIITQISIGTTILGIILILLGIFLY